MENRVEIIPGIYIGKRNAIDNPNLNNIQGIKKIIDTQSDLSFIGKSNDSEPTPQNGNGSSIAFWKAYSDSLKWSFFAPNTSEPLSSFTI